MDGLWRRGIFQKVLRSLLTPQDCVFTSRFHDKIKPKREEFDKCIIRLAVQGQHMRLKGEYSVGDYDDAFSACRKRIPHDAQLGHTTKYVH